MYLLYYEYGTNYNNPYSRFAYCSILYLIKVQNVLACSAVADLNERGTPRVMGLLLLNNKLKICIALWGKGVRLYAIILAYLAISHWGYRGILQKNITLFCNPGA